MGSDQAIAVCPQPLSGRDGKTGYVQLRAPNASVSYRFLVFRTRGNYLRAYLRFYAVYAVPTAAGFILFPLAIEGSRATPAG